jgi:hypothetical protein
MDSRQQVHVNPAIIRTLEHLLPLFGIDWLRLAYCGVDDLLYSGLVG